MLGRKVAMRDGEVLGKPAANDKIVRSPCNKTLEVRVMRSDASELKR